MPTEIIERPLESHALTGRPWLTRISWGGVFAGFFAGFGIWLMLSLLGAAIGFSSFNPGSASSWGNLAQGAGIWGGIAGIIAVFFGGWIASALSASGARGVGALHGVTVWGMTLLVAAYGAVMLLSGVVGTATNVVGAAASSAASVVGGVASGASSVVNTDAITTQVNNYLRSQNMPAVPEPQLKAAINTVEQQVITNLRQGQSLDQALNQQQVSSALASQTNLNPQQANVVATQVTQQLRSAGAQLQQTASNVGQTVKGAAADVGNAVQNASSASAWGLWFASVLMLIAAALGGALGSGERKIKKLVTEREERLPSRPLQPREV
jgi:hypothetical protein